MDLFVKAVIQGKTLQVSGFIAFHVGSIKQFVVQITDCSVVLSDTVIYFVDGVVTLFVVHHQQVVFQDGVQDGGNQLAAVFQHDVKGFHNYRCLLGCKIFVLHQFGQFLGINLDYLPQDFAGFFYPFVIFYQVRNFFQAFQHLLIDAQHFPGKPFDVAVQAFISTLYQLISVKFPFLVQSASRCMPAPTSVTGVWACTDLNGYSCQE